MTQRRLKCSRKNQCFSLTFCSSHNFSSEVQGGPFSEVPLSDWVKEVLPKGTEWSGILFLGNSLIKQPGKINHHRDYFIIAGRQAITYSFGCSSKTTFIWIIRQPLLIIWFLPFPSPNLLLPPHPHVSSSYSFMLFMFQLCGPSQSLTFYSARVHINKSVCLFSN